MDSELGLIIRTFRSIFLNSESKIKTGRRLAIISFLIGTSFLALYFLIEDSEMLLVPGYLYLCCAIVVNVIYLFILLVNLILEKKHRKDVIVTIFLMLLNIPIAYLYFIMVLGAAI